MPLIKYYHANTCYDGHKEFTKHTTYKKPVRDRYYPDEYLIAQMLEKYYQRFYPSSIRILTLVEPWEEHVSRTKTEDGESKADKGAANTRAINKLIFEAIRDPANKDALILVPFLYGYHHPGIAIDVKNKKAIYLDPLGSPSYKYPAAKALVEELRKEEGYKDSVFTVSTKQQKDGTSCGPILTASFIKFIDEFGQTGTISTEGFMEPRPLLATERLYQMYINNTFECDLNLVNEVMLADTDLLINFFNEQKISAEIYTPTLELVKTHKKYIEELPHDWEKKDDLCQKVQLIIEFQSLMTGLILAKDKTPNFEDDLKGLIQDTEAKFRQLPRKIEQEKGVSANHSGFFFPASYTKLTRTESNDLNKTKKLLVDYTKNNSRLKRVAHFHWNRHYVEQVHNIAQRIGSQAKNALNTVEAVVSELEKINPANPKGSLARRTNFIKQNIMKHVETDSHRLSN